MRKLFRKLREHFSWTFHNMVGHPLMELFHIFGLEKASEWIHDVTVPKEYRDLSTDILTTIDDIIVETKNETTRYDM